MTGDVETERFLFEGQRLLRRPFTDRGVDVSGSFTAFRRRAKHPEDIDLIARLVPLMRLAGLHSVIQRAEHARARDLRRVEGTTLDQAFNDAPVDGGHIDPAAEIEKRLEGPILRAAFENNLDGFFA